MTRTGIPAPVAILLAAGLLAGCAPPRDGLFNNERDQAGALRGHERAWHQRFRSRDVSRLVMHGIAAAEGGSCITEEDEWKRVDLDRNLPPQHDPSVLIACYVDISGRLPFDWLKRWRWTVLLRRLGPESLRVVAFQRTQGSDFASPGTESVVYQS